MIVTARRPVELDSGQAVIHLTVDPPGTLRDGARFSVPPSPLTSTTAVLQPIIDRYLRGEISLPVAVMELVRRTEDVGAIEEAWPSLRGELAPLADLRALVKAHADGCRTIVEMIQQRLDSAEPAARVDEGIDRARRLFDPRSRRARKRAWRCTRWAA